MDAGGFKREEGKEGRKEDKREKKRGKRGVKTERSDGGGRRPKRRQTGAADINCISGSLLILTYLQPICFSLFFILLKFVMGFGYVLSSYHSITYY